MSHKKPVTRRDFLAQGLLGSTAMVFAPSLISMLAHRRAYGAADCGAGALLNKTPFICIDLAGGANIAGSNVIVGKAGGQLDFLTGYNLLGLPASMAPSMAGQVVNEMGLSFHADSGFLRGIQSVTTAATRANVDGFVICGQSGDDTGNNPHNPTYWIAKSGLSGSLATLVGTQNSASGGNALAPASSINPAIRPVRLNNANDAKGLITLGQLNNSFSTAKVDKILAAIGNMSSSHIAQFQEKDLPAQVKEVLNCSYTKAQAVAQGGGMAVDPLIDPLVTQVFPNIATNGEDQRIATVAKLVLDGTAGAGTITKGGYDYHSGNRSDGETRDFEAGRAMGQCLELAAKKGKDLMLYVFTDGGVSSNGTIDSSAGGRGKGVWTGDSGERSAAFVLVYKAGGSGRPAIRKAGRQLGYFRDSGQAVDVASSPFSQNVERLSMTILLNYMALDGTEGNFTNIVGANNPIAIDRDKYLMLTKLA